MERGSHSELMHSNTFAMKPMYSLFDPLNLNISRLPLHQNALTKVAIGFHFDCSGMSSKNFRAVSAVAERPERKHWTTQRGGFAGSRTFHVCFN